MNLFKFIKDAGAKLFGVGGVQAAPPEGLKQTIKRHGFDAGRLGMSVERFSGVCSIGLSLIRPA